MLLIALGMAAGAMAADDAATALQTWGWFLPFILLISLLENPAALLPLITLLLTTAWLVHLGRQIQEISCVAQEVSDPEAVLSRVRRRRKFALGLLVLAVIWLIGWWQVVRANHTINRLYKANDYTQLEGYLERCLFCRWAMSESDSFFFFSPVKGLKNDGYDPQPVNYPPPHLAKGWKKKVYPEMTGLLCKRGADCGGVNVNLFYLNSAEPQLIDAHLSSGGQLGYLEADWIIYRAIVVSGRADVLAVLLKHGLRPDHPRAPALDLLNIAIYSPSAEQARIIAMLKAGGASGRGVPEIYPALAEAYLANSVAPVAALQPRAQDMLRYFERWPGKTDDYLYISYFHSAPLWMALAWPEKPGWIEQLVAVTGVDLRRAIPAIGDGNRQWDVIQDLERTAPELYRNFVAQCRKAS